MSPVKTDMLVTKRPNCHGTERPRLWPITARIEWEWIDLRAFVPVADLGGFRSVQFNQFPAAEIRLPNLSTEEIEQQWTELLADTPLRYALLDLDHHPWLSQPSRQWNELSSVLASRGIRLHAFRAGPSLGIRSTDSRLQAIEACLSDWENHLVTRFTW